MPLLHDPAALLLTVMHKRDWLVGRALAPSFRDFGKGSVISWPLKVEGAAGISIGDHAEIGPYSHLRTFGGGELIIGTRVQATASLMVAAALQVVLEQDVLLGKGVQIIDHQHRFDDPSRPISWQTENKHAPVLIRAGTWIGANVVIMPGVTIGRNAVVGANSVVRSDLPDYAIAVGVPARVVGDTRARLGAPADERDDVVRPKPVDVP